MLIVEGNVSIGTPVPQGRFHVDPLIGGPDGDPYTEDDNSADDFIVTSEGNVGIGIIPAADTDRVLHIVKLGGTGTVAAQAIGRKTPDDYGSTGIRFEMEKYGSGSSYRVAQIYGGSGDLTVGADQLKGHMAFHTRDGGPGLGGTSAEKMRITAEGNVGIGTKTPTLPAPNGQDGNLDVNDIYLKSMKDDAGGWVSNIPQVIVRTGEFGSNPGGCYKYTGSPGYLIPPTGDPQHCTARIPCEADESIIGGTSTDSGSQEETGEKINVGGNYVTCRANSYDEGDLLHFHCQAICVKNTAWTVTEIP